MKNANKKNNNNNKPPQSNRMFQGGAADSLSAKIDRVLARIPKGSFAAAGGALGGPVGAAAGATLAKISGYGDYVVTHNTIATRGGVGATDIVPSFTGKGGVGSNVRITHREYVGDVKAPEGGGFTVKQYAITPTNAELFPWLSDFARKFQRYKVHGMAVYYKSTSTDYNNSGIVAITINYDPADPQYLTMQGMMNSKFAVSTKPSQHIAAPVECAPSESPQAGYFIDHGANLVGAELRQTCKGMLNVGLEGLSVQPGTSVGQLYIVYDIEMMYPYHSLADIPQVPFGSSATYFVGTDDVAFAGRQVPILSGFPSGPENRLLYTSYYATTTGPHRIDIQGTPGAMKIQFQQAGTYLVLCLYKGQTIAMGGTPTGTNCDIISQDSIATIGSAETNKCAWARCIVSSAAGGVLTWWDTSYDGSCNFMMFADKLS
jgi:hypothetical protein